MREVQNLQSMRHEHVVAVHDWCAGTGRMGWGSLRVIRPIELRTFDFLSQIYRFVDANDGSLCLVTELCEGGNLQEVRCYLLVTAAS
jgi:hypothetical protein